MTMIFISFNEFYTLLLLIRDCIYFLFFINILVTYIPFLEYIVLHKVVLALTQQHQALDFTMFYIFNIIIHNFIM